MSNKRRNARAANGGQEFFRYSFDENGHRIAVVSLTKGAEVILYADDWKRISEKYGCVWFLGSDGKGKRYAVASLPRRLAFGGRHPLITMQRAIMEVEKGQFVSFLNKNSMDCRRGNLKVNANKNMIDVEKYCNFA